MRLLSLNVVFFIGYLFARLWREQAKKSVFLHLFFSKKGKRLS